jgi:hypothetical protein
MLAVLENLEHAMSITVSSVYRNQHGLVVRSNTTGSFTTLLSTGRTVRTQISSIPAAQELTTWTLDVEDFRPGLTNTTIAIIHHQITLNELTP